MPNKRVRIFERDGWRCWYCGTELPKGAARFDKAGTFDHLLPLSRGGDSTEANLVAACRSCNSQKGSKTVEEYRSWIAETLTPQGRALVHLQNAIKEVEFPDDLHVELTVEWLRGEQDSIVFYGERPRQEGEA
jgi:5-methylcytosine-specific restriction endonuclease McrA